MGLFDTILIDNDLIEEYNICCPTCGIPAAVNRVFSWQTKDLDCDMSTYQLYYDNGYRVQFVSCAFDELDEKGEDYLFPSDLHGKYEVYTKCICSKDKPYPNGSITIELKFTDGLLVDVRKNYIIYNGGSNV